MPSSNFLFEFFIKSFPIASQTLKYIYQSSIFQHNGPQLYDNHELYVDYLKLCFDKNNLRINLKYIQN